MTLKEEILYSTNYINNEKNNINEEKEINQVLTESIKNHSASNFLEKQSEKVMKEYQKMVKKGDKDANKTKEAAETLKKASAKLYKAESDYRAGNPEAKIEYKKICKEYSEVLKNKSKGLKTFGVITSIIAGAALLGTAGFTALANDDIIERLQDGIKNHKLGEVISTMRIKNADALTTILNDRKGTGHALKEIKKDAWADGYHDLEDVIKKPSRALRTKGI